MMNKSQATLLYIKRTKRAQDTIGQLMEWDETKTIEENYRLGKFVEIGSARNLQNRFLLKYKKIYNGKPRNKKESIQHLIKKGLSVDNIARLLGLSNERIYQILRDR